MKNYDVYYWKQLVDFRRINKEMFDENYVFVKTVHANSPEEVFANMQGEVFSPNGEARDYIQWLGLSHTSMSVGDIMFCADESPAHLMADMIGFKELPFYLTE